MNAIPNGIPEAVLIVAVVFGGLVLIAGLIVGGIVLSMALRRGREAPAAARPAAPPTPPTRRGADVTAKAAVLAPTQPSRGSAGVRRPPAPDLATLQAQFPELELIELIGQGGMGAVYRVRRRADGQTLALKVVSAEGADGEAFAARFLREAEALERLSHPGIVAIRAHGRSGAWCWLLMDFVDGANLRQVVATGALSAAQTLALVPPLCAALQYAHDQGVVHRDLKPENILIDASGAPRLVDFGLAKLVDTGADRLTVTGAALGTPHYMAPEQVERAREVDHRADIYALGVILYELLTGRLPLGRFEPPSQRAQVDARVDDVVLRALERDPERRWQQASQVGRAVQGLPAAAPPRSDVDPEGSEAPVRPWGMDLNTFNALQHIALFAGYILFGAGFVLTIIMWATCRDQHRSIDTHGRIAINWLISYVIWMALAIILCFVIVGIPLVVILALVGIVFPIIGAVKAAGGEAWSYPLSIRFLSLDLRAATGPGTARRSGGGAGFAIGCVLLLVLALCIPLLALLMFGARASASRAVWTQTLDTDRRAYEEQRRAAEAQQRALEQQPRELEQQQRELTPPPAPDHQVER
jgi:uncharacterized Tic20 family protein